ncbi:MAG: aminotransferase class IV [Vicinamibacteria bacterium]
MANLVNVDGKLGSEEDRLLSAFDQGFLFGASVYETIRTYQGKTFLLARHLRRLRDSADALDIRLDASDEEIAARVQETLVAAGNAESSIRIVVSAGVGAIDYREGSASRPTVVIVVRPLPEYPESLYREGARAVFVSVMRAAPGGLDPRIKSSNVLTNLMALREAHRKNAYEALMLNPRGEVAEGSMSNVFIVSKGVVRTPPISAGILEGITRELVIEVAREGGYPVEERAFAPKELFEADEVFITASARQIVPIVRVDETLIGNGNPGPVTRQLIARYQDKVSTLIREED